MSVTNWLVFSAIGVFCGLIWSWFWVAGRIYQHPEYYEGVGPQWLRLVAGKPKENYSFPIKFSYTFPKVISAVGLLSTTVISQAEMHFTLIMFGTWLVIVLITERSLKKLPSRQDKTGDNS